MTYCRTKELELQWQIARYEAQRQAAENEKAKANSLSAQVTTFTQTEAELRGQLNIYVEKFKQVSTSFSAVCHLLLLSRYACFIFLSIVYVSSIHLECLSFINRDPYL